MSLLDGSNEKELTERLAKKRLTKDDIAFKLSQYLKRLLVYKHDDVMPQSMRLDGRGWSKQAIESKMMMQLNRYLAEITETLAQRPSAQAQDARHADTRSNAKDDAKDCKDAAQAEQAQEAQQAEEADSVERKRKRVPNSALTNLIVQKQAKLNDLEDDCMIEI